MTNETKSGVFKTQINAPIQTVWDTLVKTDDILPFFFGSVCERPDNSPGAPYAMRTPNGKYTAVVGEVVAFDPPRLYEVTFRFTNYQDAPCRIRYELVEKDGGTEFTLHQIDVPVGSKTEKDFAQGIGIILSNLKSLCEDGKPTGMGRFIMIMGKLMGWLTPSAQRSEHWKLADIPAKMRSNQP